MLGYQINKEDVKLIESVNFVKTEFTELVCNIYINASMNYGVEEYYLVGKIFKDWKHQGNYTYINGIEREYKSVKPVLNAIIKEYNTCGEMNKILIFAGLKKDITETRMYKKLVKEQATKEAENNNIEVAKVETDVNSEPVEVPEVPQTLQTANQDQSITEVTITSHQPIRNKIIEMVEDENLKIELYQALNNGFKIGYTSNQRGIPQATYENYDKGLFIIINPSRLQADYISKYIYTIEDKIKEVYCIEDMELIKDLYFNNYDEFIQIIKEDSENQINQYSYEDIKLYFDNLFKLESIIPDTTEQQKELKRIALNVLNRGYSIELKEENLNYMIYLQQNKNIEGYLYINKSEWIQNKKLKLINESLKPLLTKYNDLSVCIYGVTDSIDGIIPINYLNSTITKTVTLLAQTPEAETSKPTIIDDSIKVNQAITEGYTSLKQADNVQIIGKIESHTSYISNETYDMVVNLKIIKDNNIIYEAYRIDFPIDAADKDKININDYLDDIILYINNSTLEPYWLNIQLDKLFKEKSTTRFQIAVKQLKNSIIEENRTKESQQREKELQELKTNVIELANNKNMLVAIGSENIRLLKDLQQRQTSKDFIKMILEMDINDKMLKPHLVKSFEAGDTVGLTYNEINKRLLLETKEFLQAMQYIDI